MKNEKQWIAKASFTVSSQNRIIDTRISQVCFSVSSSVQFGDRLELFDFPAFPSRERERGLREISKKQVRSCILDGMLEPSLNLDLEGPCE